MKAFRVLRTVLIVVVALGLLGALGYGGYYLWQNQPKGPAHRLAEVKRGPVKANITATGTIEPEEVVDVGAQVVGQILRFGYDTRDMDKDEKYRRLVDYCTPVKNGTELAIIDDSTYASDVDIARQDLAVAKAGVTQAESDLTAAQDVVKQAGSDLASANSKLTQTSREWERNKLLGPGKVVTQTDYDTAKNAYETANAAVDSAKAAQDKAKVGVESAKANLLKAQKTVDRGQAALDKAEKNLGYCTIKSPVDGVIVDRRVNVGQTVVSTQNAPSLFLIARNLLRLQIWVQVNEADIGNIHVGQKTTFTVDARPGKTFEGTVQQIRLNATMTQNVVTYTVVVAADNVKLPDREPVVVTLPNGNKTTIQDNEWALLPYLTANVQFLVAQKNDVLLVPNAALRYHPPAEAVAPEYRAEYEQGQRRKAPSLDAPPAEGGREGKGDNPDKPRGNVGTVWVEDAGGFVKPIKVVTGITDNTVTEVAKVLDGELPEGAQIITGDSQPGAAPGGTTNPFTPQPFNNQKKKDQ
jgi:HlyD family secretion protein